MTLLFLGLCTFLAAALVGVVVIFAGTMYEHGKQDGRREAEQERKHE